MSTWLYQINQRFWPPERYRFEIWEGERWAWPAGKRSGAGAVPRQGDTIVFFYAPSGGADPGFYGWAVTLEWRPESSNELHFRPAAPSDQLKMRPWWNETASTLANEIRGRMKQRTLWLVEEELVPQLRDGIAQWMSGTQYC